MSNSKFTPFLLLFILFCHLNTIAQTKPSSVVWGEKIKNTRQASGFIAIDNKIVGLNSLKNEITFIDATSLTLHSTISLGKIEIEGIPFNLKMTPGYLKKQGNEVVLIASSNYKETYYKGTIHFNKNYTDFGEKEVVKEYEKKSLDDKDIPKIIKNGAKLNNNYSVISITKNGSNFLKVLDNTSLDTVQTINISGYANDKLFFELIKQNESGDFILAGGYGSVSFNIESDYIFTKTYNGIFKFIFSSTGEFIESESASYSMADFNIPFEHIETLESIITSNDEVYFVLTSRTVKTLGSNIKMDKLMVINIKKDSYWTKEYPILQKRSASFYMPEHQGVRMLDKNGDLLLVYNDDSQNHKDFDYSNYTYDENKALNTYYLSSPDAITFLQINAAGVTKPYLLETKEMKANMREALINDSGELFLITDNVTGTGPTHISLVKLKLM